VNVAEVLREGCYFIAAMLFMLSLKWLGSPATARRANFISMFAMFLAVAPSFMEVMQSRHEHPITETMGIILAGLIVGAAIGIVSACKVQMTAMPQMVGLYNGFGGAASLIVAVSEFLYKTGKVSSSADPALFGMDAAVPVYLSVLIGGVCFTGSMAAFAKLQELISGKPIQFPGQHYVNLALLVTALGLAVVLTVSPAAAWSLNAFIGLAAVSLLLGWLVVIPIGGADMPVVISLMNSYSGMAVTTTGFVLRNNVLIIVGSFVGASGIILTSIMCKAMNRSLANVMFGGFGSDAVAGKGAGGSKSGAAVNETDPESVAEILNSASSIIIVPGYGMATSQAQHVVREVGALAEKSGAAVRYAIHPVAGRMPGHMNVLLAEANVPYDQLYDLDQINDDFVNTDVVLVVGANDVVNPAAKTNPSSPIYGMPVFNCELARACICLKRSMNPGFAGIDNELYVAPKTMMLFGDAKKSLMAVASAMKEGAGN
jgi:H+-translocating NAD(P) transhydrogenase subunit beta